MVYKPPIPDTVAVCPIHGMQYDTQVEAGCPLCRPNASKSIDSKSLGNTFSGITRWVVLASVLVIAALAVFALRFQRKAEPDRIVLGAVASTASGSDSQYSNCRMHCATNSERCINDCPVESERGRCRKLCLNGLYDCDEECSGQSGEKTDTTSFTYHIGAMPEWLKILYATEQARSEADKCGEFATTFSIRVTVSGITGKTDEVVVAARNSDRRAEKCISDLIRRAEYPLSDDVTYTFVSRFDPKSDTASMILQIAEEDLKRARQEGDLNAVYTAEYRVWFLREQMRVSEIERLKRRKPEKKVFVTNRQRSISPTEAILHYRADQRSDQMEKERQDRLRARERERSERMRQQAFRETQNLRQKRVDEAYQDRIRRDRDSRIADCEAWRRRILNKRELKESEIPPCSIIVF